MVELWYRLKQRGYTRRLESLPRAMYKLGMFAQEEKKTTYTPRRNGKVELSHREDQKRFYSAHLTLSSLWLALRNNSLLQQLTDE